MHREGEGMRAGFYDRAFILWAICCQRESMSFIVSASDLELISHGPLLVFHTRESSHDPGLAAQARPGPWGPAILFHMEYTHLISAGEEFIHTYTHRTKTWYIRCTHMHAHIHTLICTFTKVLSFSRFFSLKLSLSHMHTHTHTSHSQKSSER